MKRFLCRVFGHRKLVPDGPAWRQSIFRAQWHRCPRCTRPFYRSEVAS